MSNHLQKEEKKESIKQDTNKFRDLSEEVKRERSGRIIIDVEGVNANLEAAVQNLLKSLTNRASNKDSSDA